MGDDRPTINHVRQGSTTGDPSIPVIRASVRDVADACYDAYMKAAETRTERIAIRVTPTLKQQLEKVAKAERRTLSDFVAIALEALVAKK